MPVLGRIRTPTAIDVVRAGNHDEDADSTDCRAVPYLKGVDGGFSGYVRLSGSPARPAAIPTVCMRRSSSVLTGHHGPLVLTCRFLACRDEAVRRELALPPCPEGQLLLSAASASSCTTLTILPAPVRCLYSLNSDEPEGKEEAFLQRRIAASPVLPAGHPPTPPFFPHSPRPVQGQAVRPFDMLRQRWPCHQTIKSSSHQAIMPSWHPASLPPCHNANPPRALPNGWPFVIRRAMANSMPMDWD